MNRKITGILSVLALSAFTFAQAPAAAEAATPEAAAPAVASETAPAAAPVEESVSPENAVEEPTEAAAPVAVRGEDAAGAAPSQVETAAPASQVAEEPAVMVAPKAVRGADNKASYTSLGAERPRTNTVYYETVYTGDDGVPVRTVYVAQRNERDTVTMEKLMGLIPMNFKIGVHGSIGSYYMSSNKWDGDSYDGMNWRAGVMSIIPLNEYTMGIKLGVLYEQSEASQSYYINGIPYSFKFRQKKLDIPLMFTFKAPSSRIYFDLGTQVSVPLADKLRYSYTTKDGKKTKAKIDMMDENFRNGVDWSFLFGFSVMAHKFVSIDLGADIGVSDMYDGHIRYMDLDLSASSFNIGLTLYPF